MSYKILSGTKEVIEQEVSEHIKAGYVLHGDYKTIIARSGRYRNNLSTVYSQAVLMPNEAGNSIKSLNTNMIINVLRDIQSDIIKNQSIDQELTTKWHGEINNILAVIGELPNYIDNN